MTNKLYEEILNSIDDKITPSNWDRGTMGVCSNINDYQRLADSFYNTVKKQLPSIVFQSIQIGYIGEFAILFNISEGDKLELDKLKEVKALLEIDFYQKHNKLLSIWINSTSRLNETFLNRDLSSKKILP